MFEYCMNSKLLDPENILWRKYNVCSIKGYQQYKNKDDYIVEICGSSRSVHDIFMHILNLKNKRVEYDNEDNWFENVIIWPKRYMIAMQQRAINNGKFPSYPNLSLFV